MSRSLLLLFEVNQCPQLGFYSDDGRHVHFWRTGSVLSLCGRHEWSLLWDDKLTGKRYLLCRACDELLEGEGA